MGRVELYLGYGFNTPFESLEGCRPLVIPQLHDASRRSEQIFVVTMVDPHEHVLAHVSGSRAVVQGLP